MLFYSADEMRFCCSIKYSKKLGNSKKCFTLLVFSVLQICRIIAQFCRITFSMPKYFCRVKYLNMQFISWLTVFLGTIAVMATAITLSLRAYYRRIIQKKNKGLAHHIFALNELEKKMEHADVEKKMMERVLRERFEAVVFLGRREN